MDRYKFIFKTFTCCFAVFILLFYIVSCKKDSSGPDGTSSGNVSAKITVLDENGLPVSSAKVSIGSVSAISGGDGVASLAGASAEAGKINVKVEKDGFFVGFRNLAFLGAEQHSTVVKLISQQKIGTIDASASATLSGTDFKVEVTGQGFLDSAGNPVTGNVEVFAKYVDASDQDRLSELMPGGDFAAIGQAGEDGTLESYGFTAIDFKDKNGKRIIPKTGNAKVGIKLPAEALAEVNANGADLWYFDDITKIWVYGGVANPIGQEVYMTVTSYTYGNCDKLKKKATIKGELTCGSAILGLEAIKLKTSGVGYSRVYSTSTNANGKFLVEVAVEDGPTVYVLKSKGKSKEFTLTPDQTLDIGKQDVCSWSSAIQPCPGQPTVTDIDGNEYNTVKIGSQCWLRENLKVSKYRNGDLIGSNGSGKFGIYQNDPANNQLYGKLYNWYAVADSRGLCPSGWHVASDMEWKTLETYLEMTSSELDTSGGFDRGKAQKVGDKLRSVSSLWVNYPPNDFTNESGFSALPGGFKESGETYNLLRSEAWWWTSTQSPFFESSWARILPRTPGVERTGIYQQYNFLSVRCIKD